MSIPLHCSTTIDFEGVEIDVTVIGAMCPATSSYFDRAFGNYLPGDGAELEVQQVVAEPMEKIYDVWGSWLPLNRAPAKVDEDILERLDEETIEWLENRLWEEADKQ